MENLYTRKSQECSIINARESILKMDKRNHLNLECFKR